MVNATIPWYYVTVQAASDCTGEPVGPYATMTPDFGYTLSGLATQKIRITYSGGPGGTIRYPKLVTARAGQTVNGPDLVVPPA